MFKNNSSLKTTGYNNTNANIVLNFPNLFISSKKHISSLTNYPYA